MLPNAFLIALLAAVLNVRLNMRLAMFRSRFRTPPAASAPNLLKTPKNIRKTMKRMLLLIASAILLSTRPASAGDDRPIAYADLPAAARELLAAHFDGLRVSRSTVERSLLEREYTVLFSDGSKIEFDKTGTWTKIECRRQPVPQALVPQAIRDAVAADFEGARIRSIERDRREYEVELENGIDLTFDRQFRLVEVDD